MLLNRARGWIGVDVGTSAVKMAQVERRGGQVVIREAATVRRGAPWDDADSLRWSPQDSGEELATSRVLGEQFLGRTSAAIAPMALCELRGLRVADPNTISIQDVERTAEPAAGAGAGNRQVVDFWPIGHHAESQTVALDNVSVLSMARDWSLRIANDLRAARLNCRVLDGAPLALARAVALMPDHATPEPVGVLDWGFTSATFCIVHDARPLFVRRLRSCGFRQLVAPVRDALDISWEEACRLTERHAIPVSAADRVDEPTAALIRDLVEDRLNHLVHELTRTLTYLRTHRKVLAPKELLLFGGGATVDEIDRYCQAQIGIATRRWTWDGAEFLSQSAGAVPTTLLGPAIALSTLALELR